MRFHHVQVAMPPGGEESARRFYADLLGLEEIPKPPELASRGGCWFRRGEVELHLGAEDPFSPSRKAHPGIVVENLDGMQARLKEAGVEVRPDVDLGGFRRVHVWDPFGNRLELLQSVR